MYEIIYGFNKGAQALLAIMEDRESLVYSLPDLKLIQTFQLYRKENSCVDLWFLINSSDRIDSIICLDDTGDFVDWCFDLRTGSIVGATLGTFFAGRRVFDEPLIDYTVGRNYVPSMPSIVPLAPVSYVGSWFNFKKGLSGDAIDDFRKQNKYLCRCGDPHPPNIVAGPDRPIPKDTSTSSIINSQWQDQMQARAKAVANQASRTGSEMYANLTNAMSERRYAIPSTVLHQKYLFSDF